METDSPTGYGRARSDDGVGGFAQDKVGDGSPEQTGKLPKAVINAGVYKHKCSFCDSTFQKTEHLRRHERSHTKERPYECPECGKKFTRADSLVRHGRLHELNGGGVSIDDVERQRASGSGEASRVLARPSEGSRQEGEADRKGSLMMPQESRAWSSSSRSIRLPGDDAQVEPPSKRRKPNDEPATTQPRQGLDRYNSEVSNMGARMPGSSSSASFHSQEPSQLLEANPTALVRASAAMDGMPMYSTPGAFDSPNSNFSHAYGPNGTIDRLSNPDPTNRHLGAPTSALMFARNLDPHLSGHLLDHIRNPQDNYATSYRTPQSDGDCNSTPTSLMDHLGQFADRANSMGDSQGPTLGLHVETPYPGGPPFNVDSVMEPLNTNPQENILGIPTSRDGTAGLDIDSSFNFESNAYGLPMGFGIEETSDLDLLQFLASDTSIAFAHTLVWLHIVVRIGRCHQRIADSALGFSLQAHTRVHDVYKAQFTRSLQSYRSTHFTPQSYALSCGPSPRSINHLVLIGRR